MSGFQLGCSVCNGEGTYPIIDTYGVERYTIQCPECYGSGQVYNPNIDPQERYRLETQKAKYERAMAEKKTKLKL
jgi:DnaJ-class molecular chaperone